MGTQTRSGKDKIDYKSIVMESVRELFSDEQFLNGFIEKIGKKVEQSISEKLEILSKKCEELECVIEGLQQNEKLKNVCIYGLDEKKTEGNKLKETIIQEINTKIHLEINENDIITCYRIGNYDNETKKNRPVIIKFNSYNTKRLLLKNSSKFKGTKMFVAEDLTKTRWKLLKEAKTKLGEKNVRSYNGNVFTYVNNKQIRIRSNADIQNIKQ